MPAIDNGKIASDLAVIRVESDKLITPLEVGSEVENFTLTSEGTLLSVNGPAPYLPDYGGGFFAYGNAHGIFHAVLDNGNQDVLLAHTATSVRVFQGWNRTWANLIGPSGASPQVIYTMPDDTACRYPTQFVLCPNGIVIIPQENLRAFFYNGTICTPLGYDQIPSAPTGRGPETGGTDTPNNIGYFGNTGGYALGDLHVDFKDGRLGFVESTEAAASSGNIHPSAYYMQYQWLDIFGNLSALSGQSNMVSWAKETRAVDVDHARKEILWSNIEHGRNGTVGRILCRSKDIRNYSTTQSFILSGNAGTGTSGSFATLPDNASTKFPDNVPDESLIINPPAVVPIPIFKLACMAFGRLWIGALKGNQGLVKASMIGRYGTFTDDYDIYPDPSGGEITGMWAVQGGALFFTISSTFLLTVSNDGLRFRTVPISLTSGCIAPDSIQNLPDGRVIWMGRDGFYMFDGQSVSYISEDIRETFKKVNFARLLQSTGRYDPNTREYRCFCPMNGVIFNDYCFIFNPILNGWTHRQASERYQSLCVTKDHRQYMLGCGQVADSAGTYTNGVWVLDHSNGSYNPASRTAVLQTGWIRNTISDKRGSPKQVRIWIRNTTSGSMTVDVYRDWSVAGGAVDSKAITLYSPEQNPPLYGTVVLGTADTYWVRKYPHWQEIFIYVPSCEVFKLRLSSASRFELIGFKVTETPHGNSGRMPLGTT